MDDSERFGRLLGEQNGLVEAEKSAWRGVEQAVRDATGIPLSHPIHDPLRKAIREWMLARDRKNTHRRRTCVEILTFVVRTPTSTSRRCTRARGSR